MICQACAVAGDLNQARMYDRAVVMHSECEGNCDCQHGTGGKWVER